MEYQYEIWLSRWPVIYVMVGLCAFGILCKVIASISCMRLSAQVRKLARGKNVDKHQMTKRLIEGYATHVCQGEEIKEVDNYIEEAVARDKVFGLYVYQLENLNLTMMVTCFTLGVIGSLVAFLNGARDNEIVFIFTVGLALTGIMVIAEVLFRNDYHRMVYLLGMQNHLQNIVRFQVKEEVTQHAELEQARAQRNASLRGDKLLQEQAEPNSAKLAGSHSGDEQMDSMEGDSIKKPDPKVRPDHVNRQAELLSEIASARRQSAKRQMPESGEQQISNDKIGDIQFRQSSEAGIAAAKEAFRPKEERETKMESSMPDELTPDSGKTAIDNDLLEDILRSLLMDS